VHFTEGCDAEQPHLILEVTTTAATLPDGTVMEDLHERLAENKVLPSHHLVDKGSSDAELIAHSQHRHQIDLVGPVLPDTSWSSKESGRFDHSHFRIDWEAKSVRCPAGQKSRDWGHIPDRHGKPSFYVDKFFNPLKHKDSIVEAAGSYNAALDLIHTALRAESEGERYTGVLRRPTLAFALRV